MTDVRGINPAYQMPEQPPHCWANEVSWAGVAAAGGASVSMFTGNFEAAAVLTAVSGGADWADGVVARNYAGTYPEAAALREHDGIITDKICDKIRNILICTSIAANKNYSKPARIAAGAVAVREGVVGVASLFVAAKLAKEGVPTEELDSMPSSPIGKETMWEFGGGEGLATTAVIARERGHDVAAIALDAAATVILGFGVVRGIQSGAEYSKAFKDKLEALRNGDTEWQPDYKPHIGTVIKNALSRANRAHVHEEQTTPQPMTFRRAPQKR